MYMRARKPLIQGGFPDRNIEAFTSFYRQLYQLEKMVSGETLEAIRKAMPYKGPDPADLELFFTINVERFNQLAKDPKANLTELVELAYNLTPWKMLREGFTIDLDGLYESERILSSIFTIAGTGSFLGGRLNPILDNTLRLLAEALSELQKEENYKGATKHHEMNKSMRIMLERVTTLAQRIWEETKDRDETRNAVADGRLGLIRDFNLRNAEAFKVFPLGAFSYMAYFVAQSGDPGKALYPSSLRYMVEYATGDTWLSNRLISEIRGDFAEVKRDN